MERLPTSHPKAQRKDVPEMRSKSLQPLFSHMAKKPRSCQRRRRTSSDRRGKGVDASAAAAAYMRGRR